MEAFQKRLRGFRPYDQIALFIREQNAGLLLHHTGQGGVIFECFEVSPQTKAVMASKNGLLCSFPARAISLSGEMFTDPTFQSELATLLRELDSTQLDIAMPKSRKGGNETIGERDSAHPRMITDFLISVLAPHGTKAVDVPVVEKRIRDDTIWNQTQLPWRRSPLWITIKVVINLVLLNARLSSTFDEYKNFVIFLLSRIGDICSSAQMPSENLFCINAKLARRTLKLGDRIFPHVANFSLDTARRIRGCLEQRWTALQLQDWKSVKAILPSLPTDTDLILANSTHELRKVIHRAQQPALIASGSSKPPSAIRFYYAASTLPSTTIFNQGDLNLALSDFETWVADNLVSWIKQPRNAEDCTSLLSLIRSYSSKAKSYYEPSSDLKSLMLLTILDLWCGLDKIVIGLIPLLAQYSPEIPHDLLNPLLLPHKPQLERLRRIETYLKQRHQRAVKGSPSIFGDVTSTSFAIKYYASSSSLQALRQEIEQMAKSDRDAKEIEFKQKFNQYEANMERARGLSHDYELDKWGNSSHKSARCGKCNLENKKVKIKVHEWPLPPGDVQANSAVFEMSCPEPFAAWRDCTWYIIQNLGRESGKVGQNVEEQLPEYDALSPWCRNFTGRCVTYGSVTKTFSRSHYGTRSFPTTLDSVFVKNALKYRLMDQSQKVWTSDQLKIPSFKRHCRTKLPKGPYENLQWVVDSTDHSQNRVIAQQTECSPHLSLHEFIAFGSLRAGERIQWLNILRELASSDLHLNAEAVGVLFTQAVWQAGSPDASGCVLRDSHSIFEDLQFSNQLLSTVSKKFEEIEANWKELATLRLLVIIVLRLIQLSSNPTVVGQGLAKLLDMRRVAQYWTRELVSYTSNLAENESEADTEHRVLRAALICRLTYSTGDNHLEYLLCEEKGVMVWIEASIIVCDNLPALLRDLPETVRCDVLRDQKISSAIEGRLRNLLAANSTSLTAAITAVWEGAAISPTWTLPLRSEQWASNSTIRTAKCRSQPIHFNILTGLLLVDSKRVGRLPSDYTRDCLFQQLFGARVLSVLASDMPGMEYRVSTKVFGSEVHLGFDENGLVIRTRTGSKVMEALRPHTFRDDLPKAFVENYVHWMDLQTMEVYFRPAESPWTSISSGWVLRFSLHGTSSMKNESRQLLDRQCQTALCINDVLNSIEEWTYIHVTRSNENAVEVELPRYRLRFVVDSCGRLDCCELGLTVDDCQTIGTFIGLKSKLIFRGPGHYSGQHCRSVLVPLGTLERNRVDELVYVKSAADSKVRYFLYDCDSNLCRLRGKPGLLSHLYKAYLHGITTHLLPDPFTKRTGTEEALSCLQNTLAWTSSPLDSDELDVLHKISCLTPHRQFYPAHLRLMQTTEWDSSLSSLAQHGDFYELTRAIFTHNSRFNQFHGIKHAPEFRSRGHIDLLKRARHRNNAFRGRPSLRWTSESVSDDTYVGRDREVFRDLSKKVIEISSLIKVWPRTLEVHTDVYTRLVQWGEVSGFGQKLLPTSVSKLLTLQLKHHWGSLYPFFCSRDKSKHSWSLTFLSSVLAYGHTISSTDLRIFLAFSFSPNILAPRGLLSNTDTYKLASGRQPERACVRSVVEMYQRSMPDDNLPNISVDARAQRLRTYQQQAERETDRLVNHLLAQWPCSEPRLPNPSGLPHLDIKPARAAATDHFRVWHNNHRLYQHLEGVRSDLMAMTGPDPIISIANDFTINWRPAERSSPCTRKNEVATLSEILDTCEAPSFGDSKRSLSTEIQARDLPCQGPDTSELRGLFERFAHSPRLVARKFGQDLLGSLQSLQESGLATQILIIPFSLTNLEDYVEYTSLLVQELFSKISRALAPAQRSEEILKEAYLWPMLSPLILLEQLSMALRQKLSPAWRRLILNYGESITRHQRAIRLLLFAERNNATLFWRELENEGHQGWSTENYPDWLLLELENDFLIRPTQAQVAREIVSPASGRNSVLQLNMGEGKSSVIIPMVCLALANGRQLCRVIVLKPLMKQMELILSQRLAGLTGRKLFQLPFSRRTHLDSLVAQSIGKIVRECHDSFGVLLAQPEHILSLKLMSIDKLQSNDSNLAVSLVETQRWLREYSRDVLDESDEILSNNFELVYTVGLQKRVDGQPDRWLVTQAIFALVRRHANFVHTTHPEGVEVEPASPEAFPRFRILQDNAAELLLDLLLRDVENGCLLGLSFKHCTPYLRSAALSFIRHRWVDKQTIFVVLTGFDGSTQLQSLLLLRGLIAYGALIFVLREKRWLVNYGLDLSRCRMAVPYRAKGVPSHSAEFGHPDIAILLTCLSFYYTGLSNDQLQHCFVLLYKMTDPTDEYDRWQRSTRLPGSLRSVAGVNLEDNTCVKQLFPHLRMNKAVIDFFLQSTVFPAEAMEFVHKLSTSAWDIPAEGESNITTGFSGTNDNRFLLPLTITQEDLPELNCTSALVLNILLRPENRHYECVGSLNRQRVSALELLRTLIKDKEEIRILIDVGAQVLEKENQEIVMDWLSLNKHAQAGVYFDENDELMVVDRTSNVERLSASSFRGKLGDTVVFYDEAHCRGTDLHFPQNARAAVTLGPRLTKDRFVQACMRMRNLGQGQSVAVIAPPEVHRCILQTVKKSDGDFIDMADVLQWTLEQSCEQIDTNKPLWVMRGLNHLKRKLAQQNFEAAHANTETSLRKINDIEAFFGKVRDREARSLREMYADESQESRHLPFDLVKNEVRGVVGKALLHEWNSLAYTALKASSLHEEQEREVAHEVEQERELQRPSEVEPCKHGKVHQQIVNFARTGQLQVSALQGICRPAFQSLKRTAAGRYMEKAVLGKIYVTEEFAQTVVLRKPDHMDDYLRPVNWILVSMAEAAVSLLLISPFEANELLPEVRRSEKCVLHTFAPRVSKAMASFGQLSFYGIPSDLMLCIASEELRLLNLFAGTLYFDALEDYQTLCEILGLIGSGKAVEPDAIVSTAGFVDPASRMKVGWVSVFKQSPVPFLKELFGMRRKGDNYQMTHIGRVINAKVLTTDDF